MQLQGKIINFLGDSITEGHGVSDKENCRFDHVLQKECNLKATNNYGIGGTRIAHQITPSAKARHDLCFCGRAYDMDKNADVIVVYGGVNDYGHGDAPFGEMGDTTPATFCGAVYWLMQFLKSEYPSATVAFLTPARCQIGGVPYTCPAKHPVKQPDAKPLRAYVDVILQTAKEFAIPVLDLCENLGIDPTVPADYNAYTTDGLHFNDAGHAILAQKIKDFLLSI